MFGKLTLLPSPLRLGVVFSLFGYRPARCHHPLHFLLSCSHCGGPDQVHNKHAGPHFCVRPLFTLFGSAWFSSFFVQWFVSLFHAMSFFYSHVRLQKRQIICGHNSSMGIASAVISSEFVSDFHVPHQMYLNHFFIIFPGVMCLLSYNNYKIFAQYTCWIKKKTFLSAHQYVSIFIVRILLHCA